MPQTPYLVNGTIYVSRGTVSDSTVIINSDISTTTDSEGKYILDLANLADGYTSGSSYTIEAYDEFNNEYKSDTITVTGESQTKNLFLESRKRTNEQGNPTGYLTPVLIRTTGDKPTSQNNLFPVQTNERPLTQKLAYSGNLVEYTGESSPGTPTSEAKWRIKKLTYSGTNVTGTVWAKGNAEFDKIWNNRTSYEYS